MRLTSNSAKILLSLGPEEVIYSGEDMPVFITQEAQTLNFLSPGGQQAAGAQYVSFSDGSKLCFGVYQIGQRNVSTYTTGIEGTTDGGLFMAANGGSSGQHMVVGVDQPVTGLVDSTGAPYLSFSLTIPGAGSLSPSVIASSLDVPGIDQVSAIAWIGENPPPPGLGVLNPQRYYGNVNVATDFGSPGSFTKAAVNNLGIPNAYAALGPRIAFRNRTLYIGYVGTDSSNTFNIWSSTDATSFQTFTSSLTPIAGQLPSLGVQDSKLVVAWVDGSNLIHMGYWTGEPTNGGFAWQDTLMRTVPGGPDQAVEGTPPLMSQAGSGLLLSWRDSQNGPSTAMVTLP
jgi:hypothetical protein